jgi:hypothetical protein
MSDSNQNNQGTPSGGGGGAASSSPANSSFRSPYQGGFYRGGGSRNSGGGRGHGRGQGSRRSGAPSSTNVTSSTTSTKFEGQIPGLEKYVYDHVTPSQAAEAFKKTTHEIAEYIAGAYKSGVDIADIMHQRKMVKIPEPTNLTSEQKKSDTKVEIWKKLCSNHGEHIYRREENLQMAYHLILGQCSVTIKSKLEASSGWEAISEKKDVLALLSAIETLMFTFESGQDPVCALIEAQKRMLTIRQDAAWSTPQYLERFKAVVRVVEHLHGHLGYSELEVEKQIKAGVSKDEARKAVKQEYLGKLFLLNADRQRFGKLITELANARHQGNDNYPTTLVAAYDMLFHRREEDGRLVGQSTPRTTQPGGGGGGGRGHPGNWETQPGGGGRGYPGNQPSAQVGQVPSGNSQLTTQTAFTNVGQESTGGSATGTTLANSGNEQASPPSAQRPPLRCYRCGRLDHPANRCRETTTVEGHQLLLDGAETAEATEPHDAFEFDFSQSDDVNDFSFFMAGSSSTIQYERISEDANGFLFVTNENSRLNRLPQNWILLDNQSTVNVFSNRSLLRNIRETDREMVIRCNAGVTRTRMIGELPGFAGEVWYNPDGIANILSLSNVKRHYRVTFDSNASGSFMVHKNNGEVREFIESPSGLYYLVATNDGHESHHVLAHDGHANAVAAVADPEGREHAIANEHGEPNYAVADTPAISDNDIPPVSGQAVVTVASKKHKYTKRSYARAVKARQFQDAIGRPPMRKLIELIDKNLIANCPVTREDVIAAEDIFGPKLGSLKGKTV